MSVSLPERPPTLHEVRIELARRSLLRFTQYTMPEYQANWHHALLCRHLDRFVAGEIGRLMVVMPPRHGKSELVSRRLPAFLLGRDPDLQIIAASYGADLASRMNRDVQRIIDTPEYEQLFPGTMLSSTHARSDAMGSWLRNSDLFEVVGRRGLYKSAGVGGSITGHGAGVGIIDDPVKNREVADSPRIRDMVWDWYTSTFYTRLEKGGRILLTMTRWHEDDLAGRLLRQAADNPEADQWTVLRLPAIAEADGHPDDPRDLGAPLWPAKYDADRLAATRAVVGSSDWTALYQQRPSPVEGTLVKRDWWRYWRELPARFDYAIGSWDLTFGGGSSYVVGQVWGVAGAQRYLLDQVRGQMGFSAQLAAIRAQRAKWPQLSAILVEKAANAAAVGDLLAAEVPGLLLLPPHGSKAARLAAVSPQIEAGNVYVPDPAVAPWAGDYVEEFAAFPSGANDDQVDATSQALDWLRMRQSGPQRVALERTDGVRISAF